MNIDKRFLAFALTQALVHAANKQQGPSTDVAERPQGAKEKPQVLKGTAPNPARLTKAQRKATKRERRTRQEPPNTRVNASREAASR